jgi:hypothetical protein
MTETKYEPVGGVLGVFFVVLPLDSCILILLYDISRQVLGPTEVETPFLLKFLECRLILIASFIKRSMYPHVLSSKEVLLKFILASFEVYTLLLLNSWASPGVCVSFVPYIWSAQFCLSIQYAPCHIPMGCSMCL